MKKYIYTVSIQNIRVKHTCSMDELKKEAQRQFGEKDYDYDCVEFSTKAEATKFAKKHTDKTRFNTYERAFELGRAIIDKCELDEFGLPGEIIDTTVLKEKYFKYLTK